MHSTAKLKCEVLVEALGLGILFLFLLYCVKRLLLTIVASEIDQVLRYAKNLTSISTKFPCISTSRNLLQLYYPSYLSSVLLLGQRLILQLLDLLHLLG